MNDKEIWLELYKAAVAGNGGVVPDSNAIDKMFDAFKRRWPEVKASQIQTTIQSNPSQKQEPRT